MEDDEDIDKQISIVAERRVTWEAAAKMAEARAAALYLSRSDDTAAMFRSMMDEMRKKAQEASEEQHALLKRRHPGQYR